MAPKRRLEIQAPVVTHPAHVPIPLPFRVPTILPTAYHDQAHRKWLAMLKSAEVAFAEDEQLQRSAAKGLCIRSRETPVTVLGKMYCDYCRLINEMYDAYLTNIQIQRAAYIQEIISMLFKRVMELRNEIVHLVVNDYIYLDAPLISTKNTPFDIEIAVPYHYANDARSDTMEAFLQKMWQEALIRKRKEERRLEKLNNPKKPKMVLSGSLRMLPTEDDGEEVEEEEEEEAESVHTEMSELGCKMLLIQKHERFRVFYLRSFEKQCQFRRKFFMASNIKRPSRELQDRACNLICKYYRRYMEIKREHLLREKEAILMGLYPKLEMYRPKHLKIANEALYERRRKIRKKMESFLEIEKEKQNKKFLLFSKREQIMEDITDEITSWFREWIYGYGFFPNYPYEIEGGTILVVTGQYPTIDEQVEDDERYKAATKGKTKEQLANERKQKKLEEIMKKEQEKDRLKKEKLALFKARCNPSGDPGYNPKTNRETLDDISLALRKYRAAWSQIDVQLFENFEVVYGFINSIVTEDLMQQMHFDCRKIVDEMKRLDLKLLVKAHKAMYASIGKLYPKLRGRKKPQEAKVKPPLNIDDDLINSFAPLFDMEGVISRPTAKLDDIVGDLNYRAYDANVADPHATFPLPGYLDVKRRLALSCAFGSGIEPGAVRRKSVMLFGIKRNGKSFLVDAVAGEMNAVKFDITPQVFAAKIKAPKKMVNLVFAAARAFQPSVIFCKNIEQVFYKKVPGEEKKFKAKILKQPLISALAALPATEKVIFIATCSNPLLAKQKPMMKMFDEKILVPAPDYGSLERYFYHQFSRCGLVMIPAYVFSIRSMPRDYSAHPLAQTMQRLGFGVVMEVFARVMTQERICRLNAAPLDLQEFVDYMIEHEIEPMPQKEYDQMNEILMKFSPLRAERLEYEQINLKRAAFYKKMAQIAAAKAAKEAKNAKA